MTKPAAPSCAVFKGRDRNNPLTVSVTPEERAEITARATAAGLSIAAYLRAAGMSRRIGSALDQAAVVDLVKIAGDQGRLGGLLKLWLVERPGQGASETEERRLLVRLGELQGELAEIVGRV